jgi:hypothetical protein
LIKMRKTTNFYPLLPPYMDSPENHPKIQREIGGSIAFLLKAFLLGSKFDQGFKLDTNHCTALTESIRHFQREKNVDQDGNFGQDTRRALMALLGINVDQIPYSVLTGSDTALQPSGECLPWPPDSLIISPSTKRTSLGEICLFPPYLDWPKAHENPVGMTQGPSVFILKCLFALTDYFQVGRYKFNAMFCDGLANTIALFQRGNGIEVDSCFGQDTRSTFHAYFKRDIEEVPRSVLTGSNMAIQPNGSVVAWPPQVAIA